MFFCCSCLPPPFASCSSPSLPPPANPSKNILSNHTSKKNNSHALEVGPRLLDAIVAEGRGAEHGARPLRRAVTAAVDDTVADALLHGRLPAGAAAYVDVDPATGLPGCWPGRAAFEAATAAPPRGGNERRQHQQQGDDDDAALLGRLRAAVGGFPGGYDDAGALGGAGAGSGSGSGSGAAKGGGANGAEVFVLASGGYDDDE